VSYNGSGTFNINSAGQPVVTGTVIASTPFNALTADLGTGLSTAITKDGQTTTTARIPFAAGINSSLVTDATNTTTGSIITAGGVGIAKALFVGTTANIAGATTLAGVTATSITDSGTLAVTGATTLSSTLAVTGITTVAAGSAALPAIVSTTGTADTGLWFPAADTVAASTAGTERMRIDSSGNLLVGTTTDYANAKLVIDSKTASYPALAAFKTVTGDTANPAIVVSKFDNDGSTSQVLMQFLYNNGSSGLGQINGNGGGSAAFGSYSDIRLKENVADLPSQLNNIMSLRPVEFDWKDGSGHQIGFIAQEVTEVYPDIVGENADGMLTLTDMNKNDARLIKCIQEQQALILALTARITALENK
jgi:hypothetical protein